MLGNKPDPDEIPYSREDLSVDTQQVFDLYDKLPAKWEGFSGHYLGKEMQLLPILFEAFDIDRPIQLYCWNIIPMIDNMIADDIAKKIKSKTKEVKTSG
jgi:hypothetical protein